MTYLYGGNILRVDLSEGKITKETTTSYSGDFLGGRGINIKLLYDEVPPGLDPLDPASYLIFGVGPLCGTQVPASRVEVTAKSPETGFLGSSNFGGTFGPELKFAGYDHIVITGKADKPVYLWIYNDEVEIRDASHLWGKDTYETQEIIRSEVDPDAKVACIGQAGENRVHFATIQSELGHSAGRTGTGGVMGSKNLKAIVVRGTKGITLADPERYLSLAIELEQELRNDPAVQDKQKYGQSVKQDRMRMRATGHQIPRPVFSCDLFLKYQSKIRRVGCPGCPTQCMDLYPLEAKGGGTINCTSYLSPFYTVKNDDLDVLLECALSTERFGVDVVSSMGIIAWMMELHENGVITARDTDGIPMEWGSRKAILGMLKKIVFREGFGDVLANGILPSARKIGRGSEYYANQIKGTPLYTPNNPESLVPLKGLALCMVISPRGDTQRARTAVLEEGEIEERALMYRDEMKRVEYLETALQKVKKITGTEKALLLGEYEGKPELTIYFEDSVIINDCLSTCKHCSSHLNFPFSERYQADLYSAGTGAETSVDKLFEFAKKVRNLERAYCAREGMTRETDSLPKRFLDNPITCAQLDYKDLNNIRIRKRSVMLETSKFEAMKSKYYSLRGWDIATGIPTRETLEQTGLKDVSRDLERMGKLPTKSSDQ